MRREFYYAENEEKLQDYLTRMAKVLDAMQETEGSPVISEGEKAAVKQEEFEVKDYIARVLQDDVNKKAKRAASKNSLSQEQGIVFSYLMMELLDHLYKYNNPRYTTVERSFDTFAKPYVKAAVDSTIGEKRGVNKHLRKRIHHINKTIEIICLEQGVDPEAVTEDEIFENQQKTGDKLFLSKDEIREALIKFVQDPFHYDAIEGYEIDFYDDYQHIENEEAIKCVVKFLDNLTSSKKYLFIGRALITGDRPSYKELAIHPKFIEMCREDELYSQHILKGDLEIIRSRVKPENNGIRKDVEYLDPDFLDTQFRIIKRQFKRLENPEKGIELLDLLAALSDVMSTYWEKMNK